MTKLIIDATKDKILLMIIDYNTNYNITYENNNMSHFGICVRSTDNSST